MLDAVRFSSLSEFLQMGGYAFNVWSVYILFLLFVAVALYYPLLRRRRIIREQRRMLHFPKDLSANRESMK